MYIKLQKPQLSKGGMGILLTSLTPPYICAFPKAGPNEENYCKLVVTNSTYINKTKTYIPLTATTYSDGNPSPALGQAQL
jgi:hypothetical protein